ncbi:MAG TPA: ribosome biogenesis GTPase Der [Flavobacteriales bacterium]|jgi:GTP-binding protein|nr:ribosome biogenesis GTPase Der [Flavobacteriales bacterium]
MAVIAIVGRPNVGKSTFFNRLVGGREAIVDSVSGVTRDRHYGKFFWNGCSLNVIDTGGYVSGSEDVFEKEINQQVSYALEEADLILLVVDTREGLTDLDKDISRILRKLSTEVLVVANKSDTSGQALDHAEFYQLGMDEIFPISAINGSGTGELLDRVVEIVDIEGNADDDSDEELKIPRIAVIGRPNAGKSSMVNFLTGSERNIVTPVAGTTRDAIDTHFNGFGFEFLFVDTAGLRKKAKVTEQLEFYSVIRTIKAIEESDVCLLMVDAEIGFQVQDVNLFGLAQKNKKGIIILVNKWDLVKKETNTAKHFRAAIEERIAPFTDVPILFISVMDKQRVHKTLEITQEVFENRTKKIKTSRLNDDLLPIIERQPPPAYRGKYIKIKYITQIPKPFPMFAFFANNPRHIREDYRRFLENKIRGLYDFKGVPIVITFRDK